MPGHGRTGGGGGNGHRADSGDALQPVRGISQNHAVHITLKQFRFNGRTVRDIYAVGVPSIIMQSISSVLLVGLNAILIAFSEAAVSVCWACTTSCSRLSLCRYLA